MGLSSPTGAGHASRLRREPGRVPHGGGSWIRTRAFPLFANKIPSFDANFEQFSADLRVAAEQAG
ncbi:hypothetical protein J2Y66_000489 [Paenarthrobacter nitroguajacolicus]|uniref:hypothetical protein n=1 Tax=Paenarthrobacter nitroguajacolicus TaxID=211146 RepID=UPI002858C48F|nr:hypothetical protein [Paenarthrobacter nitroguajacolicus]MDR6986026.1 hypothetical protein [Paenarthrobacter nitroguajacolicus]